MALLLFFLKSLLGGLLVLEPLETADPADYAADASLSRAGSTLRYSVHD